MKFLSPLERDLLRALPFAEAAFVLELMETFEAHLLGDPDYEQLALA